MKKYELGFKAGLIALAIAGVILIFLVFNGGMPIVIDHSFDVPRPHPVFNLDSDTGYFYMVSIGKGNWDSTRTCTSGIIDTVFVDSIFREAEQ